MENKDLNTAPCQTRVSGSNLMNILEDNYELNKQFHEELRSSIFCFCVAHYGETMTFEHWLATYYS